jgi:nicotinamidase/pyrazinamidase
VKRALIIVDVQPTFCEGGELPVPGGNAVAERIAEYARRRFNEYSLVVTTQDWHVDPGTHFSDEPDYVNTWPVHGVAGSANAELHPALDILGDGQGNHDQYVAHVFKGQFEDGYSGFDGVTGEGKHLEAVLLEGRVTDVDVVGLAESHCVKHTALDAVRLGFKTRVLTDLTRPVTEELGRLAREEMNEFGVELVSSRDLK